MNRNRSTNEYEYLLDIECSKRFLFHVLFQGRPSGDAYIQMLSPEDAIKSAEKKHREHLGKRWIEVFQCSREEVSDAKEHTINNKKRHSYHDYNQYHGRRSNNSLHTNMVENRYNTSNDRQISPPVSSLCVIPTPVMTTVGLPMMPQTWNQYHQQESMHFYPQSNSPGMTRIRNTTPSIPKEIARYQPDYTPVRKLILLLNFVNLDDMKARLKT